MGIISPQEHRLNTGENVLVRSATADDALALVDQVKTVIVEGEFMVTCPEEFHVTQEQERDSIRQYGDDPGKLLIVAEASRQIIGTLYLESGSRNRLLHVATLRMWVGKDWRSRGAGTVLLRSAIEWAQSHPVIEKLSLAVFSTNSRAMSLYRKLGFVEEGRRSREVKFGPDQYVDDILMYRFVKNASDAT